MEGIIMRNKVRAVKEVSSKNEVHEVHQILKNLNWTKFLFFLKLWTELMGANELENWTEVSEIFELDNVWVFIQLIHRPMRIKNQLHKNPSIA